MSTQTVVDLEKVPAWQRRKEHRASELLAAARDLLEEAGLEQTSIAEIARRAGVSEATVYKYFANKRDLVHQVIHSWMEPNLTSLERELPLVDGVAARLRIVTFRHLEGIRDWPGLHRLIYRELRWTDYAGSELHRLNQRYARIIHSILSEGITAGEIDTGVDPSLVRDMLFGGLEHIGLRVIARGQPIDIGGMSRAFVDRLLYGLVVSTAGQRARLNSLVAHLEAALAASAEA
ncbi:MAG: TetR/AcrR family transcriptional regulator [Pseudomonadota bacterium]|nr:TetR/AcrR family transcriptional regulator [Pseudomonadota bacterium]